MLDWDAIDWRHHEDSVRRGRQRIFTATQEGDWPKVRNLQKLMLRSWSNTLVSVRQATQRNAGRSTAGIDGEVALTSGARMDLAVQVHQTIRSWTPLSVKRVYIPKANGKMRPLGIPVIGDRCHQGRARNALEPERGGPVRTEVLRVPTGPQLPRRYRGDPSDVQRPTGQTSVGAGRGSGGGVRPDRPRSTSRCDRIVPRPGNDPGLVEGGSVRAG